MAHTLADYLRSVPDAALGALIRLRPDLVVPAPADLSALATRAQARLSVSRALDGLDQFTLEVLDALRLTRTPDETTSVDAVLALTSAGTPAPDVGAVRAAVERLRGYALIFGPDTALRIVSAVDEACSPYPAGLGRPAADLAGDAAELVEDPARLRRTLLAAPPPARAVLDRLAAGPPVGTVKAGAQTEESPVGWLVAHRLLVRVTETAVELPREIGMLLRREAGPLGPLHPAPPKITPTLRGPAADSAGAGQAMELVRHNEALLEVLAAEPAPALRAGGLGVRELRRLARAAGLDEPMAALLVEIAYAAGLLGSAEIGDRGVDAQFLPATPYDAWRTAPLPDRWAVLAQAWLGLTREPRLVAERDDRDRPINALGAEAERAGAPAIRRAVLQVLADLPAGAAATPDEVLARLDWRVPRRTAGREASIRAVLTEAATLGVTGLGALTTYGRALVAAEADEPVDEDPLGVRSGDTRRSNPLVGALDALLPAPVDHLLVQADLTVVVPGPPEPALAAELTAVADHESAGGATVFRVTPGSVRRALDAGYAAGDLHALFTRRSRTPIPQALTYLIDDVARRHGGLRVGTIGAYVRSDDEALLAELLVDRRLSGLSLRRLAPTVLATPYGAGRMLAALRDAGYAPVPEDASGATVLSRPKVRRAAPRTARPRAGVRLTGPRVLAIVEQMRRGDAAARAARRAPVTVRAANGHPVEGLTAIQAHTQALAVLQQALRDRARVWVGYVDAHGATAQRLVVPVSIGAGYLRAEDERTETLHTFALHRITAAELDS